MAGRRWTEEELEKLERYNGTCTCATMAKRLGRSPEAVKIKMNRIGLRGFEQATELLTGFQVLKTYGIEYRQLQRWHRLGLKRRKISGYNTYRQEDLYKFMKSHPEEWDATKVTDDSLFMSEPWFLQKRKDDRVGPKKRKEWTSFDVSHLILRYRQGAPIRQIAEEMGRTESSIKNKMHYMTNRGFRI